MQEGNIGVQRLQNWKKKKRGTFLSIFTFFGLFTNDFRSVHTFIDIRISKGVDYLLVFLLHSFETKVV